MSNQKNVPVLSSEIYELSQLHMPENTTEQILKGGRDKFPLLSKGFGNIKKIGCIGWGSQGPAQFCNIRDSLKDTNIKVTVGLRKNSHSWRKAESEDFCISNDTLGEMFDVIKDSDLVILLISDAAQTELYQEIMNHMKSGATLGLSHGFLLGYMQSIGKKWREDINVIAVCPKGMGPSVRQLYLQGQTVNGAGINSSIAIEQDIDGTATDTALSWAIAIGSPYIFVTTMESEYKSDIFGERAILLGGVWAICETLYQRYTTKGKSDVESFNASAENITGPISRIISKNGIRAMYESLVSNQKNDFKLAYSASYNATMPVLREIYDEVESGNEIRSVVMAGKRLKKKPMVNIDDTKMWEVAKDVRSNRNDYPLTIYGFSAGFYAGMMMAQIDLLSEKGHSWSEIVNESVIEAVDSLNPYMHARGVGYMVDNCSITARLGTRKWGPLFESALVRDAFVAIDHYEVDITPFLKFLSHPVHDAIAVCAELRPSVDISVS
ncbi:MAG: ketol-acid reductoisomerase [Candidatus Gracilibacteria bacterium]|nr:ketol-acid reductoisomerase [Candidatus Gracilibacteria bacterium]MDP2395722.1 ketol-acid reductoisomerase [bacterium]MDP3380221.1 ketol-acid reductoisomerase [bacterium]